MAKQPILTRTTDVVLLVTHTDDKTADYLQQKLTDSAREFFRLDTDRYLSGYGVSFAADPPDDHFEMTDTVRQVSVTSSQVHSIWYRRPVDPVIAVEDEPPEFSDELSTEAREQYESLLGTLDSVDWVSHPANLLKAENKLLQQAIARPVGFKTPATIVTNDPDRARKFVRRFGRVICKPLSVGSYHTVLGLQQFLTTEVLEDSDFAFDALPSFPLLFQELVPKARELRLTVVGNAVVAVEVAPNSPDSEIDWRAGSCTYADFRSARIPLELEQMSISIVKRFGIRFSSMDVVETPSGEYFFLDLNPNGQWAWLDEITDCRISRELCSLLSPGVRNGAN